VDEEIKDEHYIRAGIWMDWYRRVFRLQRGSPGCTSVSVMRIMLPVLTLMIGALRLMSHEGAMRPIENVNRHNLGSSLLDWAAWSKVVRRAERRPRKKCGSRAPQHVVTVTTRASE